MIHKRGNSFGVSVYDSDRKGMRWVGTYSTEADAKAAEAQAGLYVTRWLEARPRPAAGSRAKYARAVARFIERFGAADLVSLDEAQIRGWTKTQPSDVQSAIQAMFRRHPRRGSPRPEPAARLFGGAYGRSPARPPHPG